jgi:hypothetical protein
MVKFEHPGALNKMLHVPQSEKIPTYILKAIMRADVGAKIRFKGYRIPVTKLLRARANAALNLGE